MPLFWNVYALSVIQRLTSIKKKALCPDFTLSIASLVCVAGTVRIVLASYVYLEPPSLVVELSLAHALSAVHRKYA